MSARLLHRRPICEVCQTRPRYVVNVIPFTHERVAYCEMCLVSTAIDVEALVGVQ